MCPRELKCQLRLRLRCLRQTLLKSSLKLIQICLRPTTEPRLSRGNESFKIFSDELAEDVSESDDPDTR